MPHVSLRPLCAADAPALLQLRSSNRVFLEPFEPVRTDSFFTLESQRNQIIRDVQDRNEDRAYAFGIVLAEELVGTLRLSSVVRGAWHNANLGYFVAQAHNGRGYATEAVRLALQFGFETAALHRIQAAILLGNDRSRRVLEKNDFRLEGRAPRYLRINGAWRDHDIYALTREEWGYQPAPSSR